MKYVFVQGNERSYLAPTNARHASWYFAGSVPWAGGSKYDDSTHCCAVFSENPCLDSDTNLDYKFVVNAER